MNRLSMARQTQIIGGLVEGNSIRSLERMTNTHRDTIMRLMVRVPAAECLAACMRQSPDRIFLAELRGAEAWDYLNSLNTGHPGSITTVHANSAVQTFERVATLVRASEAGRVLDMDTIRLVLRGTIDVVLYIEDRSVIEVFYDPVFARSVPSAS